MRFVPVALIRDRSLRRGQVVSRSQVMRGPLDGPDVPAQQHPVFTPPSNPNAMIWRYMDFTRYVAMLETGSLFFSRADRLDDPFEGTLSRQTMAAWLDLVRHHNLPDDFVDTPRRFARAFRRHTFLNCWHLAEYESAAMWRLYSKTDEAIAVQSTFARLQEVLPEKAHVGLVRYVDYDSFVIPQGNTMWPFLFKRRSFEHEREVRAVIQEAPLRNNEIDLDFEPTATGKLVPVDLSGLIDTLYVAPLTPDWYLDLVVNVTKRYRFGHAVRRSRLQEDPFL